MTYQKMNKKKSWPPTNSISISTLTTVVHNTKKGSSYTFHPQTRLRVGNERIQESRWNSISNVPCAGHCKKQSIIDFAKGECEILYDIKFLSVLALFFYTILFFMFRIFFLPFLSFPSCRWIQTSITFNCYDHSAIYIYTSQSPLLFYIFPSFHTQKKEYKAEVKKSPLDAAAAVCKKKKKWEKKRELCKTHTHTRCALLTGEKRGGRKKKCQTII